MQWFTQQAQPRKRLEQKMLRLKNELDFIEILSHFWPLPNMVERGHRLQAELDWLTEQHQALLPKRPPVKVQEKDPHWMNRFNQLGQRIPTPHGMSFA